MGRGRPPGVRVVRAMSPGAWTCASAFTVILLHTRSPLPREDPHTTTRVHTVPVPVETAFSCFTPPATLITNSTATITADEQPRANSRPAKVVYGARRRGGGGHGTEPRCTNTRSPQSASLCFVTPGSCCRRFLTLLPARPRSGVSGTGPGSPR